MDIAPQLTKEKHAADKLRQSVLKELDDVLSETRKSFIEICRKDDKKIIGVFGGYKLNDSNGREIIKDTARKFAEDGYVVITGLGVIYEEDGNIIEDDVFNEALDSTPYDSVTRSRFFASIPSRAIFILSNTKDTSSYEQYEFYSDRFLDKEMGIGVFISDKEPLDCSFLQINNDPFYYFCGGKDKNDCSENKSKCPWIDQLGMPFSEAEYYLLKPHMLKIIVRNKDEIFNAASDIFERFILA